MMNISLYIPRVFSNISKEFVANTFQKLGIGKVSHVDFVHKLGKNGTPYNSTYVHFKYWFDNEVARNFYHRVIHPKKEARIVYDDPWYWVVLENKGKNRLVNESKPRTHLKTNIATPTTLLSYPHLCLDIYEQLDEAILSIRKDTEEAYNLVYYQFYQKLKQHQLEVPPFLESMFSRTSEYEEDTDEDYENYMDENMSIS